jgi:sensor c-di-GMP phosphodiesterase-like protein
MVMTGGIALIILLVALLFSRRDAIDPMADMARAIRDDEFLPYYQPVVDLQSGRLIGAEVLVRWRPGRTAVSSSRTPSFCFWRRAGWCWSSPAS